MGNLYYRDGSIVMIKGIPHIIKYIKGKWYILKIKGKGGESNE